MENDDKKETKAMWVGTTTLFIILFISLVGVSFTQNDAVIGFFAVLFLIDFIFECVILIKHFLTKKKTKKEELGLFDTNTIITCNTSKVISFKVIIDGTEIGRIKDKGHLFLGLPKGTHTISFKSKFDQTHELSFEILDAPIEIKFKFVFKKKILVRTLTFEQQLELYRELTKPKKMHKSRMVSSDYEPYTDEEMDTYDLLDGD